MCTLLRRKDAPSSRASSFNLSYCQIGPRSLSSVSSPVPKRRSMRYRSSSSTGESVCALLGTVADEEQVDDRRVRSSILHLSRQPSVRPSPSRTSTPLYVFHYLCEEQELTNSSGRTALHLHPPRLDPFLPPPVPSHPAALLSFHPPPDLPLCPSIRPASTGRAFLPLGRRASADGRSRRSWDCVRLGAGEGLRWGREGAGGTGRLLEV